MIELPELVAGGLAAGTLSALALGGGLLRSRRQKAALRAEVTELRARLEGTEGAFITEVEHLAARRMPAAAAQLAHPHLKVPGPAGRHTPGTPAGIALEYVLTALREELTAQRTRIDAAAQAGLRGATREIQAALYRLQDALRGLQQRYDDPELAQTLFTLDHENEQSLRRAQVAAVVCGAWVGLAREESHVVDAVTGGLARLSGYHRVQVNNHLEPGTALVSHAVEPVAIIVAELLDNALRHSAPDTAVVVNLEHVHHGVCVTVDDAGLGMTQDERARAQRLVAGSDPILLTDLGDPPRMGLAAIGQLTRQFDLNVDLSSPSPYGGVRAVLRVDTHLLGRIDPGERPPAASAPRSTRERAVREEPVREAAVRTTPVREEAVREEALREEAVRETPVPEAPAPAVGPDRSEAVAGPPPDRSGTAAEHGRTPAPGREDPGDPAGPGGLPQRRRRTSAAAPDVPQPQPAARRPEEAAAALAALQYGTAAARAPKRANAPGPQRTDDEGGTAG
ncbi:ATP-binding protein [Streptomyces sp. Ag109_O5-10]|uniref:ATP-binding protein n=1 Tax=Streptomyces sp. Ag109_O5-10 TaxID=1855349 RepID=UPI00089B4D46|nr:ATP-binding protein [Streptomyces sp. Ag109_O5-10]SED73814.1 Signal transduction histidine kinase [Streptomyces sp. Ag109_O5-10]